MKKLFLIVLIVALPVIAFFQYQNYRRFHPPVDYEYALNDAIDVNYHDQGMVLTYYENAVKIGAFARAQWANNDIDVRFPDSEDQEAVNAATYYNQLIASTKLIEQQLLQSARYKSEGFTTTEIQLAEQGLEISKSDFVLNSDRYAAIELRTVSPEVWNLQKELISRGYDIPLDGVFGQSTLNATIVEQTKLGFYPDGVLREDFLRALAQS